MLKVDASVAAGTVIVGKVGINQTVGQNVTPFGAVAQPVSITGSLANDVTLQPAVSTTGNGANLDVTGQSTVVFNVLGTFVATVNFEHSPDAGSTWFPLKVTAVGTDNVPTSTNVTGSYRASIIGLRLVRARVTWTSGTSVTVTANTSVYDASPKVINANTVGATPTIVTIRAQSVAAGQYYSASTFLAKNGIRKVGGTMSSPDSFSCALYGNYQAEDASKSFSTFGTTADAVSNSRLLPISDLVAGGCQIYFHNADTSAHVINADLVGWPN